MQGSKCIVSYRRCPARESTVECSYMWTLVLLYVIQLSSSFLGLAGWWKRVWNQLQHVFLAAESVDEWRRGCDACGPGSDWYTAAINQPAHCTDWFLWKLHSGCACFWLILWFIHSALQKLCPVTMICYSKVQPVIWILNRYLFLNCFSVRERRMWCTRIWYFINSF